MAFVATISEPAARGDTATAYERIRALYLTEARKQRGTSRLPPIVTVFSLCPDLMESRVHFSDGLYRTGRSGLGRRREELIATQVAALSGCRYCTLGHAEFLRVACRLPPGEVAGVVADWQSAKLASEERAMLAFTEKLTLAPGRLDPDDLEGLRRAGFDAASVLAVVLGACYRNFIVRIADLLGVEHETADFPLEVTAAFEQQKGRRKIEALSDPSRKPPPRSERRQSLERVLAARPAALAGDRALRASLDRSLGRRLSAIIAVTVAAKLDCEWMIEALRGPLSSAEGATLAREGGLDGCSLAERAAIAYAMKGTLDERSMTATDVDAIRAHGLNDADVIAIATQVAYCNYAVRLAAAFDADPV